MAERGTTRQGTSGESEVAVAGVLRRLVAGGVDIGIVLAVLLWIGRARTEAGLYSGVPNEALWFYPVAGGLFVLAYQLLFLAALQATPGMIFLGLFLSDRWGDNPRVDQVMVRVLVSLISAAAFGLGYVWAVFHPRRQTWHDWAAGTLVIRGSSRARRPVAKPLPRPGGEKTYRVG